MHTLKGAMFAIASTVFFTTLTIGVKWIGNDLPTVELLFFRCFIALLVILPTTSKAGRQEFFRSGAPRWLHFARALLGVIAVFCYFYAVRHLSLAEYVALQYTSPLMLALLGWLVLDESIPRLRWLAIAFGAFGVFYICQPRFNSAGLPICILLVGCLAA